MSPGQIQAQLGIAVQAHREGRLADAEKIYARLLPGCGKVFDAWHLAGTCALQLGKMGQAVTRLRRAAALQPRHALCAMRLGVALARSGATLDGLQQLRRSVEIEPTLVAGWVQLAHLLRATGAPDEALACARQAIALKPDAYDAHEIAGALVADLEGFGPALEHFRRMTAIAPDSALAWTNVGIALTTLGHEPDALAAFERALQVDPESAGARLGQGFALQQNYQLREAVKAFEHVLAREPGHPEAHSARLLTLQYLDDVSPADLFHAHLDFGRAFESAAEPALDPVSCDTRRLRVAFVSGEFRDHAVAQFIEPLVEHLDRNRFEIWLYHDHAVEDAVSARLRQKADHWENLAGRSNDVVVDQLRAAAIDIAIDLSGHTGRNRLPAFARRLAPLQITYLGYPGTTGLNAMDARLVDPNSDPEGEGDALHTERLVRFSTCAWTWAPRHDAPQVVDPPCVGENRPVTFGSFNNYAKVSETTIALWSAVLAAVPDSRLLLKSHGLERDDQQSRARDRFERNGISGDRIDFLSRQPDVVSHLQHYAKIDIALDTFPYHGTTTTCEALWMGRPVVTLAGDRHASRVGCSLLTAVGHAEWIGRDSNDFVARAVSLAQDPERLRAISGSLRGELRDSVLMDHRAQAERFGAALLSCWTTKWSGSIAAAQATC